MGRPGAYLSVGRRAHELRPVLERTRDYDELYEQLSPELQREQASRCMMCGVAFCQAGTGFGGARPSGCPLHNLIPEWNDLVWRGLWREAAERLALTSPLPEFTSRVCPALCEAACNLGCHDEPETIHDNERAISDWEWAHGGPRRFAPAAEGAPRVAVVGSGPAGLAAAWELARRGAHVSVVERADRAGGLLTYGIPNMKLPKDVVARRVRLMEELGVEFVLGTDAAERDVASGLLAGFDAVVVAVGARVPRGLSAAGFEEGLAAGGVVFAVDYLEASTRALLDGGEPAVSAAGLDVVVIGGGDTGNDCLGTAVRQGARSVAQLEFLPRPADPGEPGAVRWPEWPSTLKTDYGQAEAIALMGGECRSWAVDTREVLLGADGAVRGLAVADLDWSDGRPEPVAGSVRELPAQLVLVACGFTGPERAVLEALGVAAGARGLPACEPGSHRAAGTDAVYVAGDARTGSSLVVSAIADAMACAGEVAAGLGL
ncbi:glutamate synthase subunit beta [Thermophilibacter sp. ET337]|uniref:glutamate synthase subunit beta n=1 Tax=Thermophilibacter sp. ET337 TaxID=2973084 RepID=UPI0021ACD8E0|nr:glutamate synthase subunit beta [Thermophilibacter sp. ET337]MCR8907221.1 glutamate synthase subunit beta [Thermophilibacter sp. ET337]